MTFKEFGDLLIYLGAVAAALSAIAWLLHRVVWRPFVGWLKAELGATRQAAESVNETAAKVHAEVTPNHGTSLKDAVDRTEVEVRQLNQRLTDHITNHPGS